MPHIIRDFTLRAIFAACMLAAMTSDSSAFTIWNRTSSPMTVRVLLGDSGTTGTTTTLGPGQTLDCQPGFCYLTADPTLPVRIQIVNEDRFFSTYLLVPTDGSAEILQAVRNASGTVEYWAFSRRASGSTFDQSSTGFNAYTASTRNLKFLGSADCQYFHYFCCNDQGVNVSCAPPYNMPCPDPDDGNCCNVFGFKLGISPACIAPYNRECPQQLAMRQRSDRVHALARVLFENGPDLRGMIIAGDLMQSARQEEWSWYLNSWTENGTKYDLSPYIFEGFGNHDFGGNATQDAVEWVTFHHRNTTMTNRSVLHHSWDWNDVHFVQLNMIPSNRASSNGWEPEFETINALSFLINDLATHVGNSGRPVILIHHFSLNEEVWWDEGQKLEYWNAIAGYNIAAILSGHTHLGAWNSLPPDYYPDWTRPPPPPDSDVRWSPPRALLWRQPGGVTRRDRILNFNVSSSRDGGALCEIQMGANNVITFVVRDDEGVTEYTYSRMLGDSISVDGSRSISGDGSPLYPLNSANDLIPVLANLPSPFNSIMNEVRFRAGTYAGPINITRRAKLIAENGLVRIGQ